MPSSQLYQNGQTSFVFFCSSRHPKSRQIRYGCRLRVCFPAVRLDQPLYLAIQPVLTLFVHSKPVTSEFSSGTGPVAISQSLVTLLVWALHRYTQELRPTASTFDADHDTRFR